MREEEPQRDLTKKHKINIKVEKPTEMITNVVSIDKDKKEATIKFGQVTAIPYQLFENFEF